MRVLQVKPVQTKARLIKQEIRFGYSVKITIEACVPGYFKVAILFLVKWTYIVLIHANMMHAIDSQHLNDKLTDSLASYITFGQ